MNAIPESPLSVGDWAQFGLGGMVIAALFVQVAWFLSALAKKDSKNQEFISEILSADRQERRADRQEHQSTTNRLADAISDLTSELRSHKN